MFQILDPVQDREHWREMIGRLPPELRDVHYSPEYAQAQRMLGFEPQMACYEWRGDFVLMPFVVKETDIDGRRARDISSLYGYGGPLCSIPVRRQSGHLARWFHQDFKTYASTMGIVTEFCALHPLLIDYQRMLVCETPMRGKNVAVIDIDSWGPEICRGDRIAGFHAAHKHAVLAGNVPVTDSLIEQFISLYRDTMLRRRAAQRWYFPDEYLRACCRLPQAKMFGAYVDGQLEVLSLVLIEHQRAYYHFTGNAMQNKKVGANDVLIASIIDYCRALGIRSLHLGGGVTSDPADSLLAYKASFGANLFPTYTYFEVFDTSAYADLMRRKHALERAALGDRISASTYLPVHLRETA